MESTNIAITAAVLIARIILASYDVGRERDRLKHRRRRKTGQCAPSHGMVMGKHESVTRTGLPQDDLLRTGPDHRFAASSPARPWHLFRQFASKPAYNCATPAS